MADNKKSEELNEEELGAVSAGMKVLVKDDDPEELSWWEKFLKLFFKTK